jgi:hypothetical protein
MNFCEMNKGGIIGNDRWNQGKLLKNGWTKKLIKELLGVPKETRKFWSRYTGNATEYLWDKQTVLEAQRQPAFLKHQTKRQQREYRKGIAAQGLNNRRDKFLEKVTSVFEEAGKPEYVVFVGNFYSALEKEANNPSHECPIIVLFPKWGPVLSEWLIALKVLAEAGIVDISGGLGKGWTKRPIRNVNLNLAPARDEIHELVGYDS